MKNNLSTSDDIETKNPKTTPKIPIRNLWLLMLYASGIPGNLLPNTPAKRQHYEENPEDIFELIAEILTSAVERKLRHNLTVELAQRQDILTRVRGRINHIKTERHHLLQRGMIACSFDEFTADTPKNRLVREALDRLSGISILQVKTKLRCRIYSEALERAGVGKNTTNSYNNWANYAITDRMVWSPEDRRMLAAAKLALYLRLPMEDDGFGHFDTLDRTDETWVRALFERAVAGFYKMKFQEWTVDHGRLLKWHEWDESPHSEGIGDMLPNMKTDIIIERTNPSTNKKSRTIIDTKFTNIITSSQHRKELLKSQHIYQLYTYLRSQESGDDDDISRTSSGMLLYPSVGSDVDEWFTTDGHVIRFATVDLSADSAGIGDKLAHLFQSEPFGF